MLIQIQWFYNVSPDADDKAHELKTSGGKGNAHNYRSTGANDDVHAETIDVNELTSHDTIGELGNSSN